jgi:hypothetical protein
MVADGARIVFCLEDQSPSVMNGDGSNLHQVASPGGQAVFTRTVLHLVYASG